MQWVGRRQTPWASILLIGLVASLFLVIGDIAMVAQISNFSILFAFSLVNVSRFFVLRRETTRGLGGSRWVKGLWILQPLLGLLFCVWLAVRTGWIAIGFGLVFALVGLIFGKWGELRRRMEPPPTVS